jgi:flagellar M-ring protein FliF
LLYLFFGVLRPMLKKFNTPAKKISEVVDDEDDETVTPDMLAAQNAEQTAEVVPESATLSYQQNLDMAKQLAKDDPKMVANIVKNWVSGNE